METFEIIQNSKEALNLNNITCQVYRKFQVRTTCRVMMRRLNSMSASILPKGNDVIWSNIRRCSSSSFWIMMFVYALLGNHCGPFDSTTAPIVTQQSAARPCTTNKHLSRRINIVPLENEMRLKKCFEEKIIRALEKFRVFDIHFESILDVFSSNLKIHSWICALVHSPLWRYAFISCGSCLYKGMNPASFIQSKQCSRSNNLLTSLTFCQAVGAIQVIFRWSTSLGYHKRVRWFESNYSSLRTHYTYLRYLV